MINIVLENVLTGGKYREETEKEKKPAAFPLVDVIGLHRSGHLTALWLFTIKFCYPVGELPHENGDVE